MLTQTQIQNFVVKAKAAGYTDQQIQAEIARKQNEVAQSNTPAPQQPAAQQPQTPAPQTPQQPTQPMQETQQPMQEKEDEGFVKKFFKALTKPAVRYAKYVGEAGALTYKTIKNRGRMEELIAKANRGEILTDAEMAELSGIGDDFGNATFMDQDKYERMDTPMGVAEEGLKSTAGAASYVIPGGASAKSLIAAGMVSGGLFNLGSQEGEGIDVEDIIEGVVTGGVTAGLVHGGGKVLKKTGGLIKKGLIKASDSLADQAAQGINKATPTMWQKAMTQHGLDLNKLTQKYFPKGGTYDDLLGNTTQRGKGGVFKEVIGKAEKQIANALDGADDTMLVQMDDFVDDLMKEKALLEKMPGNEPSAEALEQFIQAFKAKYPNGITPARLLELKRAADSKFGASVVNETTGSVTAQAQKMFANSARSKLKKLFPTIKNALDTETEVYTLRPVIERAKGIANTRGSEIRVGKLSNLTDLINPMKWMDKAMANEQVASRFIKGAAGEAVEETTKKGLVKTIAGKALDNKEMIAARGATALMKTDEPDPTMQPDTVSTIAPDAEIPQGGDALDQYAALAQSTGQGGQPTVVDSMFGGMSKQELLMTAAGMGASNKDLQEISDRYDLLTSAEMGTGTGDWSESEQATLDASYLVDTATQMLEAGDIETGLILAPLENFKGKFGIADQNTLDFNVTVGNLKATLAKARAGTSFTENEERLLDTYAPKVGDSQQELQTKLFGLKQLLDNKKRNMGVN